MGAVMGAAMMQSPRLERRLDWDLCLARWAEGRFGVPLVWGQVDCAMLCFEAIDAQCGTTVAAHFRGRWHSAWSARRFSRQVISLPAALLEAGLREVRGAPQRGDVITIPADGWDCGYVCLGGSVISAWLNAGVALAHTPAQPEPGQRVWRI